MVSVAGPIYKFLCPRPMFASGAARHFKFDGLITRIVSRRVLAYTMIDYTQYGLFMVTRLL